MPIKFTPKTPEQIASMGDLFPEGWSKFKITKCEEKKSTTGNDMLVIEAQAPHLDRVYTQVEFLVFGTAVGDKLLRNLAESVGLIKEYESGQLETSMMLGKDVYFNIFHQKDHRNGGKLRERVREFGAHPPQPVDSNKAHEDKLANIVPGPTPDVPY